MNADEQRSLLTARPGAQSDGILVIQVNGQGRPGDVWRRVGTGSSPEKTV